MLQQLKDLHFVTTDHFQGDLGRHRAGLLVEEDDPPEVDPFFCVLPLSILRVWKKKRGKRIQNKSFVSLSIVVPGSSI